MYYAYMISFKGAVVNINAFSDTHGRVENSPAAYQTFLDNRKDILVKPGRGRENFLMIAGDWFMAGNTKGYLSNPASSSQDYQVLFFNKLISGLRKLSRNLKVFFTPGNHDFDAGSDKLSESIRKMDVDAVVSSNIVQEDSAAFSDNFKKGKFVKSKIVNISDDKNLFKKHKMLVLGLSPVNMSYYNKPDGTAFIDDVKKPQIKITPKDYERTLISLEKKINKFKERHPKGIVVLMAHSGANVAQELAQRNGNIDVILDAHEHKDYKSKIGKTTIIGLSKDFKKIENIKITLNDEGDVTDITTKKYKPEITKEHNNRLSSSYRRVFNKDLSSSFYIDTPAQVDELEVANVRCGNSYLANLVTDVILEELQKIDPNIDAFGINASAIRKGLPASHKGPATRLELMFVLNGMQDNAAFIYTNKVTGRELINIIYSNLRFNRLDCEKNPIVHYSGLTIDMRLADLDIKTASDEELKEMIHMEKTGQPIELDKIYKIANPQKWLQKSEYSNIERLAKEAVPLYGANAKKLFIEHFESLPQEEGAVRVAAKLQDRIIGTSF